MIDVAVLIPHLPKRVQMMAELTACIDLQTAQPTQILVDARPGGMVPAVNRLAGLATTEWIHLMNDDDLYAPWHLEALAPHLVDGNDIVYSWPRVVGENIPVSNETLQIPFNPDLLREHNYIPGASGCIRRSLWEDLGGYRDVPLEDYDFWLRALDAGAKFHLIPEATWTWRLGPWEHMCLETT